MIILLIHRNGYQYTAVNSPFPVSLFILRSPRLLGITSRIFGWIFVGDGSKNSQSGTLNENNTIHFARVFSSDLVL